MPKITTILPSTRVLLWIALLSVSAAALAGCSPGYAMRAAYEEAMILWRAEPITTILEIETNQEKARKLHRVLEAREFAASLGFEPGDSFTRYSELDREVLAWILIGSRRDAFDLYTWWFPVVGTVPYKGFFEREDAESAAGEIGRAHV